MNQDQHDCCTLAQYPSVLHVFTSHHKQALALWKYVRACAHHPPPHLPPVPSSLSPFFFSFCKPIRITKARMQFESCPLPVAEQPEPETLAHVFLKGHTPLSSPRCVRCSSEAHTVYARPLGLGIFRSYGVFSGHAPWDSAVGDVSLAPLSLLCFLAATLRNLECFTSAFMVSGVIWNRRGQERVFSPNTSGLLFIFYLK